MSPYDHRVSVPESHAGECRLFSANPVAAVCHEHISWSLWEVGFPFPFRSAGCFMGNAISSMRFHRIFYFRDGEHVGDDLVQILGLLEYLTALPGSG